MWKNRSQFKTNLTTIFEYIGILDIFLVYDNFNFYKSNDKII